MKIGDLIRVNTDDEFFTGTWVIVEKTHPDGNVDDYKYRIIGIHHDGLESDIMIDGHCADSSMIVIS